MTTSPNNKAKPIDIQTDKGKVRCSQFDTHLEGLGIPYAAPPLGDLRLLAQTGNVTVVTVNYRLGPLGWLALPSLAAEAEDHSTGNYGLLDSIAALEWIKRNISSFGGDPDRVTIFGQSAGGEQVLALVASPLAAGLFHGAISMSAPAGLNLPTVAQIAPKRAEFAAKLGCSDEATQPACLRRLTAQQLLDAAEEGWNVLEDAGLSWTPAVDSAVLPDQWLNMFRQGRFNRVPVMVGHTREEIRLMCAIFENDAGGKMTTAQADDILKKFFGPKAEKIMQEYGLDAAEEPNGVCAKIMTDCLFATGEENDRDALAQFVPVFAYRSNDPNAPESHVHALYSKIGAGHDSDLAYLFQWDDFLGLKPEFTPEQQTLALQMGRYWGQFAASGDPNGGDLPHWPPTSAGQIQCLEPVSAGGARSIPLKTYLDEHKVAFWRSLMSPDRSPS